MFFLPVNKVLILTVFSITRDLIFTISQPPANIGFTLYSFLVGCFVGLFVLFSQPFTERCVCLCVCSHLMISEEAAECQWRWELAVSQVGGRQEKNFSPRSLQWPEERALPTSQVMQLDRSRSAEWDSSCWKPGTYILCFQGLAGVEFLPGSVNQTLTCGLSTSDVLVEHTLQLN